MNLNQVTIYTNKFAESLDFYKKLGLKIIVDSSPRYVRFEFSSGDSTFSLHETSDSSNCSNIVLYFECENLDEEFERFKNLGVIFDQNPKNQTWFWREAYLKDSTGNKICLFHVGENRKKPPWKVK